MPNSTDLRTPPELRGTADEKLQQLWSWLYQTVELLQIVINKEGTADIEDSTKKLQALSDTVSALIGRIGSATDRIGMLDSVVRTISNSDNMSALGAFILGYSLLQAMPEEPEPEPEPDDENEEEGDDTDV